jgi:hypothetical protein
MVAVVALLAGSAGAEDAPIVLDFEVFPDGATPAAGQAVADAYADWGVSLTSAGSQGSALPAFALEGGRDGLFALTADASNPPGNNIVVEFDQPVLSVSAEVFSDSNKGRITLTAYDASGTQVDAVTSATGSPDGWGWHPIGVDAGTPKITRVTFTPDLPLRPVGIDDLTWVVPEPASLTLLAAGGTLLAIRRRRPRA